MSPSTSKAKGTTHERDVCRYLNAHGFPHAERFPAGATLDRGDLAAVIDCDGDRWTVEVKRWRDQSVSAVRQWCAEAEAEAANGSTGGYWLVVGKRWGSADVGDSPVWLPVVALAELLSGATPGRRRVEWERGLEGSPDLLDRVACLTLRSWCALAGDGT